MKKRAFFILTMLLYSQITFAEHLNSKNLDVLAICSASSKSTPLFEILGDLDLFSGPRLTVQFANVVLKSTQSRIAYKGIVTLTKNAPYQYILNGFSTPSVAGALSHSEEVSSLYGISSGAKMTIVKNSDGLEISSYSCALNTGLLLNP